MNLIRNELLKQRKHVFTLLGFGLLLLLIVYSFSSTFDQYATTQERFDQFVQQEEAKGNHVAPLQADDPLLLMKAVLSTENALSWSMLILSTLGPIVACIIGSLLIGNEYRFGTVRYLLTHGASRTNVLLSKVAVLMLILGGMILLLCIAGVVTVMVIDMLYGMSFAMPAGPLILEFLVTFLGLFLWGLVGFSIALFFRNPLPGVALGIGWPILEAAVLDRFGIRDMLPLWNQKALLAHTFERLGTVGPAGFPVLPEYPDIMQALLITLVYVGILIASSQAVFQRQQIS
ncbi:ABC transporter permease [Tumebacillus lipolyticus]|uniref:ABC transporter permease n=1 Tax=Tumebacillus lipolyticus TaxID=1280370 RepID=A0ABW4ZY10_9BACL